jgi:syntaxin 1B/2/3
MEQTLAELAQLFIDVTSLSPCSAFAFLMFYIQMGTLVEQQDAVIKQVQDVAASVHGDTEKG